MSPGSGTGQAGAPAEAPIRPPAGPPPAGSGFDELIHAPVRLRMCAALDHAREIEFGALMTLLDVSKSALSKHVSALAEAGYVSQRRAVRDSRQRVWLRLTDTGRSAYRGHVAALHEIVGNSPPEA